MNTKYFYLSLVFFALLFSCKKNGGTDNEFAGVKGGEIKFYGGVIEIPAGAVTNGAFTVNEISSPQCDGVLSKHYLHSNVIYFNSSITSTQKPIKITMRYNMCDVEEFSSCVLSDVQAAPYSLSILGGNALTSVNDSTNYTNLNILQIDTIGKTITFETSDLTKMYLIGREL